MDIINYIAWVKENKLVTTITDLDSTLIPLGLKDPRRDDNYLSVGISVQSLANIIGGGGGSGTVTSVGATAGTGISIGGTNPITTSGSFTITNTAPDQVVTLTDGTGISVTGLYPNFTITNTSPDQVVVLTDGTGISVTGTYPNFTITNTQPSSGGTVTSVGLTMPSAFSVANSPITGSGTINVTGSGTAGQYVRGDGSLAVFPDISGGGGGQVYYLNGNFSQGTILGNPFYQLSTAAAFGPNADFISGTVDNVQFADFITDIGKPTQETIPAGVWIFQCYFSATSNTAQVYATVEIYDGVAFTVWATSLTETITNGSTIDLYTFTCAVPEYTPLTTTDRVAIRFYATNLGGVDTVTLHTEDSHLGSIQTTFTTGVAAIDGLSAAAQYLQVGTSGSDFNITTSGTDTHVFNLPTASALNRGALSTSDWTTFNSKQNAITLTTTGTSGSSTFIGSTLNVPTYTLSGLGGVPSSRQLTINGTAFDLTADRSWSVGTVTSVSALTLGTSGTDLSSSVATGTTTPVITLNVPTASATNRGALSSSDWSTFNNKIGGSGTTSYVPRFTGTSSIGNGIIQDNGTNVGINTSPASYTKLNVVGTALNTESAITAINTNSGATGVYGLSYLLGTAGTIYGLKGESYDAGTTNIGVYGYGWVNNYSSTNSIGGKFEASGATNNYSVQLIDGTQNTGKFLKSVTSDGKANWATLTVADTGLTLTTTGTTGAATLVGNTLNIPNYSAGITPVVGSADYLYLYNNFK